jgi:hypothetical protein
MGIKKDVASSDLSGVEQKSVINEILTEWGTQKANILMIRDLDLKFSDINIKIIKFLSKDFDQWVWDKELDQITFHEDEELNHYNTMISEMNGYASKQLEAQRALLSN